MNLTNLTNLTNFKKDENKLYYLIIPIMFIIVCIFYYIMKLTVCYDRDINVK